MINLKYDEIVLGFTLEAVLFAYMTGLPIVLTKEDYRPIFFDFLPSSFDFDFFGIEKEEKVLTTPEGDFNCINSKEELYNKLLMIMAAQGSVVARNYSDYIHLSEDLLHIKSKKNIEFKIQFNKCHLFDLGKTSSELDILYCDNKLEVYDFYNPTFATSSTYDLIQLGQFESHHNAWFINPWKDVVTPFEWTMIVHSTFDKNLIKEYHCYPKIIELTIRDYLSELDAFYNDSVELEHNYRIIHDILDFEIRNSETVVENKLSFEEILDLPFKGDKYHYILENLK